MTKPNVFIGSSSEGLDFARAVRSLLAQDAEVTLWNEGFFGLGNTFIETLINSLPRFDFAILILTPDDLVTSRNAKDFGPRDNVIFEVGLFMGHLGRTRAFMLHQANASLKMPTDLAGVTTATYEWPRTDRNHKSAVGAACDTIRIVIRDLGISEHRITKEIGDLKSRQESTESRLRMTETKVDRIFAYTMPESMFRNLQKLSSGNFGVFKNSEGLWRELRHLRDVGYITVTGHIADFPDEGDDLSRFVRITSVGKEFVELRENLEKTSKND